MFGIRRKADSRDLTASGFRADCGEPRAFLTEHEGVGGFLVGVVLKLLRLEYGAFVAERIHRPHQRLHLRRGRIEAGVRIGVRFVQEAKRPGDPLLLPEGMVQRHRKVFGDDAVVFGSEDPADRRVAGTGKRAGDRLRGISVRGRRAGLHEADGDLWRFLIHFPAQSFRESDEGFPAVSAPEPAHPGTFRRPGSR